MYRTDEGLEVMEDASAERLRVTVRGCLDLRTAPDLCARLGRLQRRGRLDAVLDLSELDYCDSTGLRALILASREAEIERGRLLVIPPAGGAARRLFELVGADEMLRLTA
jgi:anti-anti-sigma factor